MESEKLKEKLVELELDYALAQEKQIEELDNYLKIVIMLKEEEQKVANEYIKLAVKLREKMNKGSIFDADTNLYDDEIEKLKNIVKESKILTKANISKATCDERVKLFRGCILNYSPKIMGLNYQNDYLLIMSSFLDNDIEKLKLYLDNKKELPFLSEDKLKNLISEREQELEEYKYTQEYISNVNHLKMIIKQIEERTRMFQNYIKKIQEKNLVLDNFDAEA